MLFLSRGLLIAMHSCNIFFCNFCYFLQVLLTADQRVIVKLRMKNVVYNKKSA